MATTIPDVATEAAFLFHPDPTKNLDIIRGATSVGKKVRALLSDVDIVIL